MTAMNSKSTDKEVWFSFTVPLPPSIDDEGIERAELDKQILQRALILAGRDPHSSFLRDPQVLQKMVLVFKQDSVKVKVPVPVIKQMSLLEPRPSRGNRTLSLFTGRGDEFAQEAAEKCLADVRSVEKDIQSIGDAIALLDHADDDQAVHPIPRHENRAVVAFAVGGGAIDVDVDGHPIHIQATPTRAVWTAKETTRLTMMMIGDSSLGRRFKGKVVQVHDSVAGACKVGAHVKLGFLNERLLDRALLIIAAVVRLPVTLKIRQATSIARQTDLTAEVLGVENAIEIVEALLAKLRSAT